MLPSSLLNAFNPAGATKAQREAITLWGCPDWDNQIGVNLPFTAPLDCLFRIHLHGEESSATISVNGHVVIYDFYHATNANAFNDNEYFITLAKGDVVSISWGANNHSNNQGYFPLIGVR